MPTSAPMPRPPRHVIGAAAPCPVTRPGGNTPTGQSPPIPIDTGGYGNDALWTNLWMVGEGLVVFEPGGPGFVLPDGALGIKWVWYRYESGRLSVEGRRLDAPAPPPRADVPDGYGGSGFLPTYLIFPTPGC